MALEDEPGGDSAPKNFVLVIAIGEGTALAITSIEGFRSQETGLAAGDIIVSDLQKREEGFTLQANAKDGFRKIRISCIEKK